MTDLIVEHFPQKKDGELNIGSYGFQSFEREQVFLPPRISKVYMLHFVIKGEGTLTIEDKRYPLQTGALFLCPKNVTLSYHTSTKNPYAYFWLDVDGSRAEEYFAPIFSHSPVVYPQRNADVQSAFQDLVFHKEPNCYHLAVATFFKVLHYCQPTHKERSKTANELYTEKALSYLHANYQNPDLKINHIAQFLHLAPQYVSRVFSEQMHQTMASYLISLRMKKAKELLSQGLPVTEVSERCGYTDLCNFSKTFKKTFGVSPKQTRIQ